MNDVLFRVVMITASLDVEILEQGFETLSKYLSKQINNSPFSSAIFEFYGTKMRLGNGWRLLMFARLVDKRYEAMRAFW